MCAGESLAAGSGRRERGMATDGSARAGGWSRKRLARPRRACTMRSPRGRSRDQGRAALRQRPTPTATARRARRGGVSLPPCISESLRRRSTAPPSALSVAQCAAGVAARRACLTQRRSSTARGHAWMCGSDHARSHPSPNSGLSS